MFDFFDWLVNFFTMVWDFISNLITSMVTAIAIIGNSVTLPFALIGFVPAFIGSCISIIVAVAVVKLILGWSGE